VDTHGLPRPPPWRRLHHRLLRLLQLGLKARHAGLVLLLLLWLLLQGPSLGSQRG
jgi:hypothetical protein